VARISRHGVGKSRVRSKWRDIRARWRDFRAAIAAWLAGEGPPVIRLIAAIDEKRGIATASGIPWHLRGDSEYFRAETVTGLIVMGSATYAEFAAPLHGRVNYVLTSKPGPLRAGFEPFADLDAVTRAFPADDVWVIGGAAVYAGTIGRADQLFLTQVVGDFRCIKFFPPYADEFELSSQSEEHVEARTAYCFEQWRRRGRTIHA